MARRKYDWTDERIGTIVGNFLRAGVIIASFFVFIGGAFYLMKYGEGLPEYKIFSGEPADLRTVHGIVKDAFSLRSRGIIQFGLLLMMSTPVAWVAFLLLAFARQRDRLYVAITAIVLTTLLFSLVGRYLYN
jgi:uncharacterized membrane protein